jgi:hypothetical protein
MYDDYSITLHNISMMYCPSLFLLMTNKRIVVEESDIANSFSVFKNFNIEINSKVMKPVFIKLNLKESRTIINANLNALEMNFDSTIINNLKQIANIFIDEG